MRKFSAIAVLICLALFVASCGKKEVKKTTVDSKIATQAFAVAEALRAAYVNRQIAAMEAHTTKDGFRSITGVLKTFDSVELAFTPVWVDIDGDRVHLNVSWKGKWISAGNITEERGMAVFVLKGNPLKVDAILRANPFRYPE